MLISERRVEFQCDCEKEEVFRGVGRGLNFREGSRVGYRGEDEKSGLV